VLDAIVRRLVDELRPERIYLFGSRARGDATEDSDYDVLVVVEERAGAPFEMEQRSRRALRDVRRPMDIVIVTRDYFDWMLGAAASLPATVYREGRLLYGR
jgi:predicted nucleotidyltransferase